MHTAIRCIAERPEDQKPHGRVDIDKIAHKTQPPGARIDSTTTRQARVTNAKASAEKLLDSECSCRTGDDGCCVRHGDARWAAEKHVGGFPRYAT